MPGVGDLVTGMDAHGNAWTGEVFALGDGFIYIEPQRQKDAAGQYIDLKPVRLDIAGCAVIERMADRAESFAQRDRRVAELIERFEALRERGRGDELDRRR